MSHSSFIPILQLRSLFNSLFGSRPKFDWFVVATFVFWLAFGSWMFTQTISWRSDGWYLGHGNVWSDWSLHISQITRFAFTEPNLWGTSTYYAGAKFTYPFLSNLLSGVLVRGGWSYPLALIVPSLVFWAATLGVLQWFGAWFLRSARQAALAISLFFCSAGFGLLRVFGEDNWWVALQQPTRDYTQFVQYQWGTGNLFLGMFLPQRAFLLGFWLGLAALGLWLRTLEGETLKRKIDPKRSFFAVLTAGLVAGILPIAHMHSFMVIVLLSAGVAWIAWKKSWRHTLLFAIVSGTVATPLYFRFVHGGIQTADFFQWQPGWTATGLLDWINQWSWQWGLMLPLGGLALWQLRTRLKSLRWSLLASFWGVFTLANFIQFQPVAWDNTKLFLWVYWGLSLSVAGLFGQWWHPAKPNSKLHQEQRTLFTRAGIVLTIFLLTFTGAFELLRSSHIGRYTYQATSLEAYELAIQIRESTAPESIFATAPVHNHWVTLWAGRSVVMGYSTWVWNFGYPLEPRQTDLAEMYRSPVKRRALLDKYKVDFIVVGPEELEAFGPSDWSGFPLYQETTNWKVYKAR